MFQKIRELSKNLAIYGLGDVAISVVNFLLLPLYVQYLSPGDYGALRLLGSVEVIAKIFFRWGLDGSFMRFFYDCEDDRARQRLASTIFFFLLAVNGVLLAGSLAASPVLSRWLFDGAPFPGALQLTLLNTFLIGFTFFPFHVLRMEERAVEFSALTLARSVGTVVLRIVLIVGLGLGVLGIVIADLLVTLLLMLVLLRWFAPLIRPVFSRVVLRDTLRFGLPRVPHAAAQQVMAVGDTFILKLFVPLSQIGVYAMGVSFGLTLKLFLSAFEYAWAPFYYANAREPDAARIYSFVTTYGVAVLALLTAGISAIAGDLLLLVVGEPYVPAASVVAWTAVGVLFQGVYLLTSIGLNITRNTQDYPVSTGIAAATNVAANFLLIPRYGILGAAWANGLAYVVQAGVAYHFSQRVYPVKYETGRLVRIAAAALIAWILASVIPLESALAGVLVRGTSVVGLYAAILWGSGFFRPEELQRLAALQRKPGVRATQAPAPETTELAGQIVTADIRDEADTAAKQEVRR